MKLLFQNSKVKLFPLCSIPQLSVSGSSPPPAGARVSPHLASVKSEPMSPRHPAQHGAGDSLHGPRSHLSPGEQRPGHRLESNE